MQPCSTFIVTFKIAVFSSFCFYQIKAADKHRWHAVLDVNMIIGININSSLVTDLIAILWGICGAGDTCTVVRICLNILKAKSQSIYKYKAVNGVIKSYYYYFLTVILWYYTKYCNLNSFTLFNIGKFYSSSLIFYLGYSFQIC